MFFPWSREARMCCLRRYAERISLRLCMSATIDRLTLLPIYWLKRADVLLDHPVRFFVRDNYQSSCRSPLFYLRKGKEITIKYTILLLPEVCPWSISSPGNLIDFASRALASLATWVLFPALSRPSMTMKAPRMINVSSTLVLKDWGGRIHVSQSWDSIILF